MEPRERDWIIRAQSGDLPAFGELVNRHDAYIMRLIRSLAPREDAEDLWQETFIKAYAGLAGFREESSFRTWLTRIAVRQCFSLRRKGRWKRRVSFHTDPPGEAESAPELSSPDPLPDQQALRQEMWDHLQRALEALPGGQRAAFVLKYVQGCSIHEVAVILGKAEGTIKSDLFRAMHHIRRRMQRIYAP
ncbi:MAG TPA: RNA polymerase sigma factor [bacterium]|nr:RNA polymerase sigma factor [bacterium]HQG44966.1 RNA polymerase sigma factor [bacterium]HQI47078.1 RNA polymerase sigma factor [bacterium]HQJ65365.1 RNA polymerase sigma factor [bacterium]